MTEQELRQELINQCRQTSAKEVAERFEVERAYIYLLINGQKPISRQIADKLGYAVQKTFQPSESAALEK